MSELVISAPTLHYLNESLGAAVERGAVLYLTRDLDGDRYLVREVELAQPEDCLHASASEITFAPQFLTRVTRRARERGFSLALLHTHPSGYNDFSPVDDETEVGLQGFMCDRNPAHECFSVVLCDGQVIARTFGAAERVNVRIVGAEVLLPGRAGEIQQDERYDRQMRAFGEEGQAILSSMTVAIVGLGGTGSVAAQQLAHLGVGSFVLVDADVVERTNLNRVVGTMEQSVGRKKVDVAAQMIEHINPNARVSCYIGSVISGEASALLRKADCIFICTDSHSSRAFVSEFSYQYLVPAIDVGVGINAHDGKIQAMTGRTQMLAPGLPCLMCSNALDPRRIREELMTDAQRAADPYFNEGGVKQPAVISLNGAIVSLAVTMLLGAFTAIPARARWQSYDAVTGTVRVLRTSPQLDCGICGADGVVGAGDSRRLTFLPSEDR
ncbi:HesA/MoeB/ThiF family protein [Burkholderia sp. 22313]|uniref:HesA/MoeB/ThiF family protein n=1 Tax=Burkholderia sp. 22313 TaxID=3453908 RepID=UPI003F848772